MAPSAVYGQLGVLLTCVLAIGCQPGGPSASVDLAAARELFVLSAEPDDPQTVLDLREREGGFEEGEIVLVGQVGGMPNPWHGVMEEDFPWRKGVASFFVVDPSTVAEFSGHDHAHGEDHSDCVFCQKRAADSADSVAAVSFNGPNGEPLAVGVQELFGLKANDIVVVSGHAKQLDGSMVVVEATGIYVRN